MKLSSSMTILLVTSLIVVLGVNSVKGYDESDAMLLKGEFYRFITELQIVLMGQPVSIELMRRYSNVGFAIIPTLDSFKAITGNVLSNAVQTITEQRLQQHPVLVVAALVGLCGNLNGNANLNQELKYENLPLRDELWGIYVNAEHPSIQNGGGNYEEAKLKFATNVCAVSPAALAIIQRQRQ